MPSKLRCSGAAVGGSATCTPGTWAVNPKQVVQKENGEQAPSSAPSSGGTGAAARSSWAQSSYRQQGVTVVAPTMTSSNMAISRFKAPKIIPYRFGGAIKRGRAPADVLQGPRLSGRVESLSRAPLQTRRKGFGSAPNRRGTKHIKILLAVGTK